MAATNLILAVVFSACATTALAMAENPPLRMAEGMWKWETVSRGNTITEVVWIRPCPLGPKDGNQASASFIVAQSPVPHAATEGTGLIPLGTNQVVVASQPRTIATPAGLFVGIITTQIDGRVTAARLSTLTTSEGTDTTVVATFLGR